MDPLEKLILGKSLEEFTRIASSQRSVANLEQSLLSRYDSRLLGLDQEGPLTISEEDRANHIHILGTTREGKSKFLEHLIRHDIDHGYGLTLLDPSDNGKTAYDVLRYCCKIGYDKVLLIDPHDHDTVIPAINPLKFRGKGATEAVVSSVMDSIRLLWGQSSFSETPRIETYLNAILTVLYNAEATIPDAVYFSVKELPKGLNLSVERIRRQLLEGTFHHDKARLYLEEVFTSRALFLNEFKSTIRRLSPFFDYLPRLMYGRAKGIDFGKLIAEKWVILVNLDKSRLWGAAQQRLLGTLVVNEIVNGVLSLKANNWGGRHYLYIDEAGQFATRVLADIMAYKGKSGLWATVSHQFYNQFEDSYVLDAVENLCKIKVLFYTPNSRDRDRMIRDMYTGELKTSASDAHAALKKQHAVVKVNKTPPVTLEVPFVDDPKVDERAFQSFKLSLYNNKSLYSQADEIREEIKQRFAVSHPSGRTADGKLSDKPPVPNPAQPAPDHKQPAAPNERNDQPLQPADTPGASRKSVFDSLADSASLLPKKGKRPARQHNDPPPEEG